MFGLLMCGSSFYFSFFAPQFSLFKQKGEMLHSYLKRWMLGIYVNVKCVKAILMQGRSKGGRIHKARGFLGRFLQVTEM